MAGGVVSVFGSSPFCTQVSSVGFKTELGKEVSILTLSHKASCDPRTGPFSKAGVPRHKSTFDSFFDSDLLVVILYAVMENPENIRRHHQFSSVAQSCPALCDPMDCRTP